MNLYKQGKIDGRNQGIEDGYMYAFITCLYYLHEQYGWGAVRLNRILTGADKFIVDHILTNQTRGAGYQGIEIDDMINVLHEECGFCVDKNRHAVYFKGRDSGE